MSLWLLESILNSLSELQHPVQFGGQFLPFLRRKLADNVLPSLLGDVSGAAPVQEMVNFESRIECSCGWNRSIPLLRAYDYHEDMTDYGLDSDETVQSVISPSLRHRIVGA